MDRLTGGTRPYLLLTLMCLFLYMPGLVTLPPLDRDESRFMQATRQMLETGDYVRIQFQSEMRAKKPAGAYWAQAASVIAFSDPTTREPWPYRLPSLLAAWAATLMTFGIGRRLFGPPAALLGAALLASCLMVVAEAHQAKTDAILLATVVLAQGVLGRFYLAARRGDKQPSFGTALIFWIAVGVSVLIKGPVVPVILLLTILSLTIFDRRIIGPGWLWGMRPIEGLAIAIAIAAPWFFAISQATDGAFVGEAVKNDLLPKLLGAQESHGAPPGMYLLLSPVTLWPASLLLVPALIWAWGKRAWPEVRFCFAWIIPTWVMFELIPTKLPHYVLPVFPALALLMAASAWGGDMRDGRGLRLWATAWSVIALALAGAVLLAPLAYGDRFDLTSLPAFVAIAGTGLLSAWLAMRGRVLGAAFAVLVTSCATFPVVLDGVLPQLNQLWVSRSVAELVATRPHQGPVVVAGYSEPSLVFLLGTDTRLTTGSEAAAILAERAGTLVLISDREEAAFQAECAERAVKTAVVGKVKGFNYSRGRPVALTAYAVEDKP
ncbi:ArnT family glycosyltransferase [Magnetospirillum molischianum]|uniref:4-amino-4-deoxy-L-arabinose transferase and related glycosyltransferase of PMT family n=1 Tax=Magnetospirillum molischianum DSM 120 TaxID=1150626 RepID=H8FTT7_MAGML|nr:glycosyltransferase family 39 protein [Magnetospirillum molischianum]CCG41794.1 4-amino-4-deoxy-L-arabinose transferase and related glycosyltransferase of PMT family [Magnetospirillum molischianum DSM 120]